MAKINIHYFRMVKKKLYSNHITKTFVTYCQHYKTNINIKEILQCDSLERFKVTLWEMANMNLYQPDQVFPLLDVLYC